MKSVFSRWQLAGDHLLAWCALLMGMAVFAMAGCSSSPDKPAPKALSDYQAQIKVSKSWAVQLGPIASPLSSQSAAGRFAVVTSTGLISVIDPQSGSEIWRLALDTPVSAGLGGDGQRYAVVSRANELMVVAEGKLLWRQKLPALSFTTPLVAGGRVFVLTADRTVMAFDGASGQKLWSQQRSGDPLVLKQAGILTTFQDSLMVGLSGRMVAMSPSNGVSKWEMTIGASRGTNEVERLVDLVAGVSRVNQVVCARSYQTAVTCIDAAKGSNLWTRAAQGHVGLGGNDNFVFGAESDGKLFAWQRANGQVAWQTEAFRFRGLTAPVWSDGELVIADDLGWLHWIDVQNGQTLARFQADGSGIVMPPVRFGKTWVAVSKNGLVQAIRTE
jgi:outer membrane assembly lipoprotein YfgL